jgi:hypothetical protein
MSTIKTYKQCYNQMWTWSITEKDKLKYEGQEDFKEGELRKGFVELEN